MPIFEYKGIGDAGKPAKGVIEADSSKSARSKLKQKGIYPTDLKERAAEKKAGEKKTASMSSGGVKLRSLTMMIRQLATMVKARIPLDEALAAVVEQTDDTRLKSIMSQVRESVNEGKSLAE